MPKLSQGNIFDAIERADLLVVFGHVGFNLMSYHLSRFADKYPEIKRARNPFEIFNDTPLQLANNRWIWFVQEGTNHGMTDELLAKSLDASLSWASNAQIKVMATNGIANADRRGDASSNRENDDQRARFLLSYATAAEKMHGIGIELVNLSDVFVRLRQ